MSRLLGDLGVLCGPKVRQLYPPPPPSSHMLLLTMTSLCLSIKGLQLITLYLNYTTPTPTHQREQCFPFLSTSLPLRQQVSAAFRSCISVLHLAAVSRHCI